MEYFDKLQEMKDKPLEQQFTEQAVEASLKRWKNKNLESQHEFETDV